MFNSNNPLSVLRNSLRQLNYTYQQRALNDAQNLMSMINTLQPKQLPFSFDNNSSMNSETLVCLEGTIPMYYQTKRYNIPVRIFLTKLHPVQAPICYVNPTQDMMIKPNHKNVGQKDGRIYLPYLSTWNFQKSNLYELANVMGTVFGQDPPVFKKPTNLYNNNVSNNTSNTYSSGVYNTGNTNMNIYNNTNNTNNNMNTRRNHTYGGHSNVNSGNSFPQPNLSYFNTGGGGSYNPQSGTSSYGGNNTYSSSPSNVYPKIRTLSPEEILQQKREELSARVGAILKEISNESAQELSEGMKQQKNLENRARYKESKLKKCLEDIKKYEEKEKQMKDFIEKSKKSIEKHKGKEINVDEVIKIQDVLSKQFIEVNAKKLAYEDLMYYMDQAVLNGNLSLQEWERETMKLARKQFFKKALLNKIQQKKRF